MSEHVGHLYFQCNMMFFRGRTTLRHVLDMSTTCPTDVDMCQGPGQPLWRACPSHVFLWANTALHMSAGAIHVRYMSPSLGHRQDILDACPGHVRAMSEQCSTATVLRLELVVSTLRQ